MITMRLPFNSESARPKILDAIIVGQGLAGTTLAWQFQRRGMDFALIDRQNEDSASRVAAGLITPVNGKRFAVAQNFDALLSHADFFYDAISEQLDHGLLHKQPALRICYGSEEVERFEQRADTLLKSGQIAEIKTLQNTAFSPSSLSFLMPKAARLDIVSYLGRSKEFFKNTHQYITAHIDPHEIGVTDGQVRIPSLDLHARHIIFCGGAFDRLHPWCAHIPFECAKGEILQIRSAQLDHHETIHARGSWLCSANLPGQYLFGASYERDELSLTTTSKARAQLVERLDSFLLQPYQIIDQYCGIRPIGPQRKVIIARHPQYSHVICFNGLASKGVLIAPYAANALANWLEHGHLKLTLVDHYG